MKSLVIFGRILFAVPFFVFGIFHFIGFKEMAGMVPDYLPFPEVMVILSGIGLVLASVSILVNIKARLACILLAIMLLIFILIIHYPEIQNSSKDVFNQMRKQMATINLLKDMALMGAALTYAAILKK